MSSDLTARDNWGRGDTQIHLRLIILHPLPLAPHAAD